ncbi:MAG TPA: helix-turn-helix domain-containing protein [Acidothermaceae bacterium]
MPDPITARVEPTTPPAAAPAMSPDRHARGRERRRNRVYDAALALFMEKGFEETTMDDIAERADVARTSVFNYFSPKTAFLDEWGTRRREEALRAVESEHLEDASVAKVLQRYMAVLGVLNADARAECVVMMGASLKWNNVVGGSLLAGALSDVLDQARLNNQIREDIDIRQAGLLLAVGYFAALATWIAVEPEPFDIRDYLAKLVNLILNGLLESPPHASAD